MLHSSFEADVKPKLMTNPQVPLLPITRQICSTQGGRDYLKAMNVKATGIGKTRNDDEKPVFLK